MLINGIDIPVYRNTPRLEPVLAGYSERSFSGSKRGIIEARKRVGDLRTSLLEKEVGQAVYTLLKGAGDSWSFDGELWSSKGERAAVDSSSYTPGKFGNAMYLASPMTLVPHDPFTDYTVQFWRHDGQAFAGCHWDHHVLRSEGGGLTNGSPSGPLAWASVDTSENEVHFTQDAGTIDEVLILPVPVTRTIAEDWYALEAQFPAYPRLRVEDALLAFDGPKVCEATVVAVSYEGHDAGYMIDFELEEV